jgi:hypothetical protein
VTGSAVASFVPVGKRTVSPAAPAPTVFRALLDCSGVVPLQIGDSLTGSTVGVASNVDAYACSAWPETGGEVVYSLSVVEPSMFEVRILADCDLDLALLSSCDAVTGCLLVADAGIRTIEPTSGEWFVVVDGYEGAACDFTLEVAAIGPGSVDELACDTATSLNCESSFDLSGDTCSGEDHVRELGCEAYPAGGSENWYRLTLAPGGEVTVDLSMADGDAALWLLGGCGAGAECLEQSDAGATGEPETLHWVNQGVKNRTVFVVVDSYEPGSCGAYEGTVTCDGFIIPMGSVSWSALKSRFTGEEQ